MHLISKHFIALFFLFSFSSLSYAGGVALAATRIVYPMDAKQTSITLNNTDKRLRFLVQSWIDDSQDQKVMNLLLHHHCLSANQKVKTS